MQFLSIFPDKLSVEKTPNNQLVGTLFFNFEQYGLQLDEQTCPVMFHPTPSGWRLSLGPMPELDVAHFDTLTQALNHYVLEVLQFDPRPADAGAGKVVKELYFDDVFFDLSSTDEFFKPVKSPKKN
jgi:hypothetical protein